MCEKAWSRSDFSEPARAGSEKNHSAPDTGAEWCDNSSEGKPSDETIRTSLASVREEIERAMRLPENAFTCALGALSALERRIVALEKESREVARPPQADQSVAQKISELRESLEDSCCPQGTENSSSKEEEYILVAPIRGIDEDGRLILGDRKIMSASALKI